MPWVQLLSCKQIEIHGKPTNCVPGDWVQVNKTQARQWLASGEATIPTRKVAELLPGNAGVVLTRPNKPAVQQLAQYADVLQIREGEPALPYSLTLIWDTVTPIKLELIPQGFHLLETWQLAVPLRDYKTLALHLGDEEDRRRTRAVLPDLRVPVYNSGAIWARRCPATEALMEAWAAEPGDRDLAFLRALYRVKPLVLALPWSWTSSKEG